MSESTGPVDETEKYDSAHGHSTLKDEQKPSGLSEGSNKPAEEKPAFKITTSGG